jgi:hypothetical protein
VELLATGVFRPCSRPEKKRQITLNAATNAKTPMAIWNYAKSGQVHGPVSFANLQKLVAAGKLQSTDKVCKEGASQWVLAGSIPLLFPRPNFPKRSLIETPTVLASVVAGNLIKMLVWLGVTVWCFLPFVWLILTLATNSTGKMPPASAFDTNSGSNPGLGSMTGLGGAGLLFMAFSYGVWCVIGVVCGFGVERALTVAGELVTGFSSKLKPK